MHNWDKQSGVKGEVSPLACRQGIEGQFQNFEPDMYTGGGREGQGGERRRRGPWWCLEAVGNTEKLLANSAKISPLIASKRMLMAATLPLVKWAPLRWMDLWPTSTVPVFRRLTLATVLGKSSACASLWDWAQSLVIVLLCPLLAFPVYPHRTRHNQAPSLYPQISKECILAKHCSSLWRRIPCELVTAIKCLYVIQVFHRFL